MTTASADDVVDPGATTVSLARRILVAILAVVGGVSAALAFRGAVSAGVGWDSVFDTGASLAARSVDPSLGMQAAYDAVPSTSEFYGVLVYQLADLLHGLVTRDTALLQPLDPATYAWQASVTVLLSVLAAAALALLVRVALGSWLAAAFAWALLLSLPLWMGMSFVDFKDAPVASGFTLVSVGLGLGWVWRASLARAGAMTGVAVLGACLAVGTRGGAFLPLGALVVGSLGLLVVASRPWSWRLVLRAVIIAGVVMAIPLVFAWLTDPVVRAAGLHWLKDSIDVARMYPWVGKVRTAGTDLMSNALPWWYVPAWLLAQLPIVVTVSMLGGAVALVLPRTRRVLRAGAGLAALSPLLVQGVVLPALVVASGAVLYDGIRHLLFVIPACVALASVGCAALDGLARGGRRDLAWLAPAMAVALVGITLFASVRWFPYTYAHVNPVADRTTQNADWELDYWGVSAREGVERLSGLGLAPVLVLPEPRVGQPFGAVTKDDVAGLSASGDYGVYVFHRWGWQGAPEGCELLFTIVRDGHALGSGARCPR
jgi:hypothetical protein